MKAIVCRGPMSKLMAYLCNLTVKEWLRQKSRCTKLYWKYSRTRTGVSTETCYTNMSMRSKPNVYLFCGKTHQWILNYVGFATTHSQQSRVFFVAQATPVLPPTLLIIPQKMSWICRNPAALARQKGGNFPWGFAFLRAGHFLVQIYTTVQCGSNFHRELSYTYTFLLPFLLLLKNLK